MCVCVKWEGKEGGVGVCDGFYEGYWTSFAAGSHGTTTGKSLAWKRDAKEAKVLG